MNHKFSLCILPEVNQNTIQTKTKKHERHAGFLSQPIAFLLMASTTIIKVYRNDTSSATNPKREYLGTNTHNNNIGMALAQQQTQNVSTSKPIHIITIVPCTTKN